MSRFSDSINSRNEGEILNSMDKIRYLLQNPLIKKIESKERKRIDLSFESLETLFLASRVSCVGDQYLGVCVDLMYLKSLKDRKKEEMKKYFEEFQKDWTKE